MRATQALHTAIHPLSRYVDQHRDGLLAALLLLPAVGALFIGIGHPLQDLNEGLYARIPQEMLASGHWIVPTLNGVPYLEKPPLLYWLTALAYAAFGANEWTARLTPVLGIALAVAAVHRHASRQFGREISSYAVWIFLGMPVVVVMGRTLLFDALFTGLLAWSLVLLYEHWTEPGRRHALRWSYAALALAVLTKGLAALVIFAGVALVFAATCGRRIALQRLRTLLDPAGLGLFLAVAAPWHLAAALQEPGFAWFYFVNEHVNRFLGTRIPLDYHDGPWWYHVPRLALYAFPWILAGLFPARRDVADRSKEARRFLWTWLLVPLAVFSASSAKGGYFMLVGIPALALLLARHAAALRRPEALLVVPCGWLVALFAGDLLRATTVYHEPLHANALLVAAVFMAVLSIVAVVRRDTLVAALASGAVAVCGMAAFSNFFAANTDLRSAKNIAAFIASHAAAPVYVFQDYENVSSLPFYLDHRVGVVDSYSNDLWYGVLLHPDFDRFPGIERFAETASSSTVWLVVARDRLETYRKTPLAALFDTALPAGRYVLLRSHAAGERHLEASAPRR